MFGRDSPNYRHLNRLPYTAENIKQLREAYEADDELILRAELDRHQQKKALILRTHPKIKDYGPGHPQEHELYVAEIHIDLINGVMARRAESVDLPTTVPEKVYKTRIGRYIDRLRKDCGWSFDELEAKTGLDKNLSLGHVNEGKGATPRTLKTYADAFSKKLNRIVNVAEIEG